MAIDDDLWRIFVAQRASEFANHVGLFCLGRIKVSIGVN
jgi:hypothetical protein